MNEQEPEEIRRVAIELDNALERKDTNTILDCFSDDCEIELFGVSVKGREGVRKWLDWLFDKVAKIKLDPIVIMIEGNTFFEEFEVRAKLHNGETLVTKQAEVLLYEDYKVKSLRLYFDRLEFMDVIAEGILGKTVVKKLIMKSLEGLT